MRDRQRPPPKSGLRGRSLCRDDVAGGDRLFDDRSCAPVRGATADLHGHQCTLADRPVALYDRPRGSGSRALQPRADHRRGRCRGCARAGWRRGCRHVVAGPCVLQRNRGLRREPEPCLCRRTRRHRGAACLVGARGRLHSSDYPRPALPQRGRENWAQGAIQQEAFAVTVGLNLLLVVSAALLSIGALALVVRRNGVVTLLGAQFMLLAGGIAFVALGRFGLGALNRNGSAAIAMFAGATALAQLAIGLAMAAVLYRAHRSFVLDADAE